MSRRTATGLLVLWLTAVWVGLWGSVTAANVLGGLVLGVVLVVLLPLAPPASTGSVRAGALARFAVRFVVDLVVSTWQVAGVVLRPRAGLRQGIVGVHVPGASDALLTLLGNAISLTPGTLTVDVDRRSSTLYVHALDVGPGPEGVEQVRRSLQEQAAAASRAVGPRQVPR